MRRVDCPQCGVKVEAVPWAEGKKHTCKAFELFLAGWARKLSWKETAESFRTSWNTVFRSVKFVVEYGLEHRNLDGVEAIGVDEIQFGNELGCTPFSALLTSHSLISKVKYQL